MQAEAFDYPAELFEKRVWHVPRQPADRRGAGARRRVGARGASGPLIVAGGGVLYSEATEALRRFAAATGIPVAETQAGKGALPFDHPLNLGAIGVTGTPGANVVAREADLVIGVGTRYSDFTTASKTAFQNPEVRFININVAEFDAYKHAALPLTGDARATLEELAAALGRLQRGRGRMRAARDADGEVGARGRPHLHLGHGPLLSQGEVIGAVNYVSRPRGRGGLRRRQPARRPAQALAHARAQGLPPRIRLLLHGLRDRRRPGRQDGRPGARGLRDGRRRLVT